MRPSPRPLSSDVQILVEGRDPCKFFEALIEHLAFDNVQVQDFGGVTELRDFLSSFTKMSGFSGVQSLGIVRDAEQNATGAFHSVRGALEHAGLSAPDTPGQRAGASPAISVMILPDNERTGMLKTLLCDSFSGNPVRTCIDAFFKCVEVRQGHPVHRQYKARARAFLATKRDPHLSVGDAAKRGYWDMDHAVLEPIRAFLHDVVAPR